MTLQLLDSARTELQQAVAHYNEQSDGLGDQFLLAVEELLAQIEKNPLRFGKMETLYRRTDVRRALVAGFPYYLPFQTIEEEILVVAVSHASRKPNYWRRRLKT
ncbi:MAG TPA: type II toxin-antitoxin system RelE/ParE family toxin [Pirellulales bacterium]|nr:type II toxin-antitoxin system RelE/ParE family toxin [Pirellulales bacterium]